jgi:UDP-N-acetylmuramoyl-tripeptide--D-alanyl-D-alanine ligase
MVGTLLGERVVVSPASFNNLIGLAKTACLINEKTETVVFEMGMNAPGEIRELCETFRPLGGCITNIGDAHIGKLGGKEGVVRAKKEMFDYFVAHTCPYGIALNVDDVWVMRAFRDSFQETSSLTFGQANGAAVRLATVIVDPKTGYLQVSVAYGKEEFCVVLPIYGRHQAHNLCAAIAIALCLKRTPDEIRVRLPNIRPAKHRGEIRTTKAGGILIDESYNYNPTALQTSLESLAVFPSSLPRLLILGAMGELEPFTQDLHRQVGEVLLKIANQEKWNVEIVGVGAAMTFLLEPLKAAGFRCRLFDTVQPAVDWLKGHLNSQQILFVKGSRAVQLDRLVDAISQEKT